MRRQSVATVAPVPRSEEHIVSTRAVLIGINYFGTSSQLNGCINDVNNMYRWLTENCGYDPAEIRVLTDEDHVPAKYRPTRANILEAFAWLHEIAPKEGEDRPVNFFVNFSGHGSYERDINGDERDGRDESICPVDYHKNGTIIDDEIRLKLINPIANLPSVKMSCLFDCCHSGTIVDLRYEYEIKVDSDRLTRRSFHVVQNKAQSKTIAKVTVFSGSLDKQYSADAWIAGKAQGAMTWGFLKVLRKYQARNTRVTLKRLLSETQILLKKNGYEQIPQLCCGHFAALNEHFEP